MGRNAETVRKFYNAFNRRDWDSIARMLAPSVEWFHAARGELVRGTDGVIALLRSSADAFPDAKIEVRALHESGEFVIAECAFTRPRQASSEQATFCEVAQLRAGKCVRGTTYADTLQILIELDCNREKSAA